MALQTPDRIEVKRSGDAVQTIRVSMLFDGEWVCEELKINAEAPAGNITAPVARHFVDWAVKELEKRNLDEWLAKLETKYEDGTIGQPPGVFEDITAAHHGADGAQARLEKAGLAKPK